MDEAQWIVTAMVIPLAVALWHEREKRLKAEWECNQLKDEIPKAVDQLHKATRELVTQSRAPSSSVRRGPVPRSPPKRR